MDAAAKATDKRLKKIEKDLQKVYRSSAKDVTKKWNEYMSSANERIKKTEDMLAIARKKGDEEAIKRLSKALEKDKLDVTLGSMRYNEMIEDTTRKLANVNKTALAYVNNEMPWVYTTNYNEAATALKNTGVLGMSFSMVDESTVRRLALSGDIQLPRKGLGVPKDMAWNTKQLNSSVLQGIMNGESMDDIAKRIKPIVNNNEAAAIRNARTMVTGAQNMGRIDSYHRLQDMGTIIHKVWMATHDDRTRNSHALLDGEEVELDKEFSNGLMEPGDPNGDPEEVYNCRCTITSNIIGFVKDDGRIEYVDDQKYEPDYEFEQLGGKE